MHFFEGIRLALHQIRTEQLKSFFSLLGVIMGVMFLIVVVSIVEGLDRYVREDLASVAFGVNTVTLRRFSDGPNFGGISARERARRPRITYDDWELLKDRLSIGADVGVESETGGEVVGENGRRVENAGIAGVSAEMFDIRNWGVAYGRPFSPQEDERGAAVVVLGKDPADLIFEDLDPIGRRVRIRGFPYRVIGVLEEQGSIFGQSLDNLVIAPARSPIEAVTNPHGIVDKVVIKAHSTDSVRAVQAEAEGIVRAARRLRPTETNNFSLETADETLSFWDTISRVLFTALPALVAVSLVVGGIVIMNIMLVSVMERTREIGIRKAIGARRRDILGQVLIETVTLSLVGAGLGVLLGIGVTGLVAALSPLPGAIDIKWISAGVALGVIVGVVSGVYPAARASRLDPVDALRYE